MDLKDSFTASCHGGFLSGDDFVNDEKTLALNFKSNNKHQGFFGAKYYQDSFAVTSCFLNDESIVDIVKEEFKERLSTILQDSPIKKIISIRLSSITQRFDNVTVLKISIQGYE